MLIHKKSQLLILLIFIFSSTGISNEFVSDYGLRYNVISEDVKIFTLTVLEDELEQKFTIKVLIVNVTANGVIMDYSGFEADNKEKICIEKDIYISCFFKWLKMDIGTENQPILKYQALESKLLTRTTDQSNWTDYSSNDPGYTITDQEIKYHLSEFDYKTNLSHVEEIIFDLNSGWLKSSSTKYEHKESNKTTSFSFVENKILSIQSSTSKTSSYNSLSSTNVNSNIITTLLHKNKCRQIRRVF
jgi:hypothetical protein